MRAWVVRATIGRVSSRAVQKCPAPKGHRRPHGPTGQGRRHWRLVALWSLEHRSPEVTVTPETGLLEGSGHLGDERVGE